MDVVLVHAFPFNSGMWAHQVEALRSAGHRALAVNLPGFGGRALVPPNLNLYAQDVLKQATEAGMNQAVFVGLSMGGYVCFRILAHAKERVLGLVLADTRSGPDTEDAKKRRTELAVRVRSEGTASVLNPLLPQLLARETLRNRGDIVEQVRELMLEATPEGVAAALLAMRDRPDSSPLLEETDVPVLVVAGEKDVLTPPSQARVMAQKARDGTFEMVPRAGHLSAIENPQEFNTALFRFLSKVGAVTGRI